MGVFEDKIAKEEGFRSKMYLCTEGKATIGYGFNLEAIGIPEEVASYWLKLILDDIYEELNQYSFFNRAQLPVKVMLSDMRYQLGMKGLLGFKKMLAAIEHGDMQEAARQLMDSRYAKQTPNRAMRNAEILRTGEL